MQTSTPERIQRYEDAGYWGSATLCSLLAHQVAERPHAVAAVDQFNKQELTGGDPQRLSFKQLDDVSSAMALDLLALGVRHGDRMMVQLPNVVELMACYYAASKLGAVISPLPVQYGRHEIGSLAIALEPSWFIGTRSFRGQSLADHGSAAVASSAVLAVDEDFSLRGRDGLSHDEQSRIDQYLSDHPRDANAIFSVCWTSGTTGTPKGVPRSHNMWLASGRMTAVGSEYQQGDLLLNPFPMVNMSALGGFLFPAVREGCGVVLHHPLDVPVFLQQIQQEQITFTIAPPALLNKLAKEPELWRRFDFSQLRAIGSGSAPLAPDMIDVFENDYGVAIYNIYGSNEGIALISSPTAIPDARARAELFPRSGFGGNKWRGELHESVKSKVIDPDDGRELTAPGDRGELCFSGPTVFDGYLGAKDDGVFTQDGFFRTGDLVDITGDQGEYYRIAGRLKDIINRGGMKISPSELDALLDGFQGLAEVAVCAYPDDDLGERVCVCVVPSQEENPPTLDELCEYLIGCGVATFKLPERIRIVTALPRNPLGKILRHELSDSLD
ncbi:MAG: acyl--CoA ligase [Luminiphilus sp.]|nr:acyl--CoA ligase [Luminiphilus sp.]